MSKELSAILIVVIVSVMVGLIGVELGAGKLLNDWLTR